MTAALIKLVAAGAVCAALLTLCNGAQRELLRFGCSCLMMVVLLSLLRQTPLPSFDIRWYEEQVRLQVEAAQNQSLQAQLEQIGQELAGEAQRQAAVLSLQCRAQVSCIADEEGRVTVQCIKLMYDSGPREQLPVLRQQLSALLGIPSEQIIIQEANVS